MRESEGGPRPLDGPTSLTLLRTSQDTQRCTLDNVTRLAALIAVCATIPALGRLIWLMVQRGDEQAGTYTVAVSGTVADPDALVAALRRHLGMGNDGDMPYGGYPK